jgi:hypothetical protein
LFAILGRFDISNDKETDWMSRDIISRKMHENYKYLDPRHIKSEADIAILIMSQTVVFTDYIQPACLPTSTQNVYKMFGVVAGYGQPDPYSPHVKNPLFTGLTSVDLIDCLFSSSVSLAIVSRYSFCAGNGVSVPCFGKCLRCLLIIYRTASILVGR